MTPRLQIRLDPKQHHQKHLKADDESLRSHDVSVVNRPKAALRLAAKAQVDKIGNTGQDRNVGCGGVHSPAQR